MIDLHTHVLPAVDDGVQTVEEAVEFARVAYDDGIRTLVATPHCREGFYVVTREEVRRRVGELRAELAAAGVDIDLLPGAEVHICPELPERVRDGRAPTLGDNGRTLLLELSLSQYPVELPKLVFQLKLAGLQVLFAHPERVRYFQDDLSRYAEVVRLGAYGQLTSGSVLGTFGESAREFSEELLRKGLIHVLASDAHNVRGRPPRMREAAKACAELVGPEFAESMTDAAPRALLDGRDPQLPAIERPRAPRRGSWLARLFGREG